MEPDLAGSGSEEMINDHQYRKPNVAPLGHHINNDLFHEMLHHLVHIGLPLPLNKEKRRMPVYINGWLEDFRPKVRCRISPAGAPFGPLKGVEVTALVDTGATDCHIRPTLQQTLGLRETERAHTSNVGVAGIKPATRITATLVGQNEQGQLRAWAATDARAFIDEFDPTVDVILGMNVLRFLLELKIANGVPSLIAPN
jgi:hypothetical protein